MSVLDRIAVTLNQPVNVLRDLYYIRRNNSFYSDPTDIPAGAEAYKLLTQAAKNMGIRVKLVARIPPPDGASDDDGETLGRSNGGKMLIELKERTNKTGMAATLAHELSHLNYAIIPSAQSEAIAEGAAAIILEKLGIDWEDRAADYLSGYRVTGAQFLSIRTTVEETAERVLSYIPAEGKEIPKTLRKQHPVDALFGMLEVSSLNLRANEVGAYSPWPTSPWPLDTIRAVLPQQDPVDVPAGYFDYIDSEGKAHHSLFLVHTIPNDSTRIQERPQDDEKRQDDLNEQYVYAYDQLQAQGASRIRFSTLHPDPFF